jgi:hypothetical protein
MVLVPHLIPVQQSERRQLASRVHFLRGSPPGLAHHSQGGRPDAAACQLTDSKGQMVSVGQIRKRPPVHNTAQKCIIRSSQMPPQRMQPNVTRCNTKMDKPRPSNPLRAATRYACHTRMLR